MSLSVANTPPPTANYDLFPGNLPRELVHNAFRDSTWAAVSALNINTLCRVQPSLNPAIPLNQELTCSAFVGPMGAQWLFASAPMLLIAGGETFVRKMRGEELTSADMAKIWAPAVAASLAIPMWDMAQTIGTYIGVNASCFQNSALWYGSSIAAGMIAAPFVGIFEGFTQWTVKYLFDVATNPVTREMWRQDPGLMGKLLAKEFALNITIGAIGGAVWQIVYFFLVPLCIALVGNPIGGIILAAILVGLAVMMCNFGTTHLINKVSAEIDKKMGWDKRFELIQKSAIKALALSQERRKVIDNESVELMPLRKKRISH